MPKAKKTLCHSFREEKALAEKKGGEAARRETSRRLGQQGRYVKVETGARREGTFLVREYRGKPERKERGAGPDEGDHLEKRCDRAAYVIR